MKKLDEATLRERLVADVRREMLDYVCLRHEDVRSNGIPDMSLTGHGMTSWWEFKHGTPDFKSHGLQELTMKRLASKGRAFYVVWKEQPVCGRHVARITLIVCPKNLATLTPTEAIQGFDNQFVMQFMRKVHNDGHEERSW